MKTYFQILCAVALVTLCLGQTAADLNILGDGVEKHHHHHHKNHRPDFCHDRDCPHFKVKANNTDYEERAYDAGKPMLDVFAHCPDVFQPEIRTLFQYFNGANEDEKKFNMTTPVITAFKPENNFTSASQNFTVSFYLPDKYQEKHTPPRPNSEDVFRFCTPRGRAFVANFTGVALEGTILQQAKTLAEALKRDEIDFVDDAFLFATYDPPQQLLNRYNEVWFMEKRSDGALDEATTYLEDLAAQIYARLQRVFGA